MRACGSFWRQRRKKFQKNPKKWFRSRVLLHTIFPLKFREFILFQIIPHIFLIPPPMPFKGEQELPRPVLPRLRPLQRRRGEVRHLRPSRHGAQQDGEGMQGDRHRSNPGAHQGPEEWVVNGAFFVDAAADPVLVVVAVAAAAVLLVAAAAANAVLAAAVVNVFDISDFKLFHCRDTKRQNFATKHYYFVLSSFIRRHGPDPPAVRVLPDGCGGGGTRHTQGAAAVEEKKQQQQHADSNIKTDRVGKKTYRVTRQLGKINWGGETGECLGTIDFLVLLCRIGFSPHTHNACAHTYYGFRPKKTTYHAHYYYYHYLSGKIVSGVWKNIASSSAVVHFVGSVSFVCSSCVVLFPVVGASLIPKFRHNRSFPSHLFKLFRNSKGNV